jgi:DNA-binding MarR family transcriptional regulator
MNLEPQSGADNDEFDPMIAVVLELLWRAQSESPDKPWVLAKLSKQAGLPMSSLRRTLTQLKDAGLVEFTIDEAGRGTAALTQQGGELCKTLSGMREGGASDEGEAP